MVCFYAALLVAAQSSRLTSTEAKNHVGERATYAGLSLVASTHYAARTDEPYPRQVFTILIWGTDRAKFGDPETKFQNKRVCVTGTDKGV
jgi:hypothetical protein